MRGAAMEKLRRFDWVLFLSMLALIALGATAIRSAGLARPEEMFHGIWLSTLASAGIGLVLYFVLAFTDYRAVLGVLSIPAYAVSVVLLAAVLLAGSTVYGGRRWLWFFQPSEISKICVIALLANVFGRVERTGLRGFLAAAVILAVPVGLILAEPDLGTALTLVPAAVLMLFAAGVWRRGLVTLAAVAGIATLLLLGAVYEAEKPGVPAERRARILSCVPLKPHQIRRVRVFLFPERDRTGAGYNLRQAKISIGSGGFAGKGLGRGESNHLKYLPQAISMNDFIFCVYAEETGFVGSTLLLALFGVLLLSGCRVAIVSHEGRGRLLALGVSTLIFAHVYVNIAMSLGIVPITGLPLPFISSGRTFLVMLMCALGLVQSVSIHRERMKE